MSTRIIRRGSVAWQSRDWPRPLSTEELPHPVGYLQVPDSNYTKGPWGLTYRVLQKALPEGEWLTMPEMVSLLGKPDTAVVKLVKDSAVDCAMVSGSTVPLFRIRDRVTVLAVKIAPPEPGAEKPKPKYRPKGSW